MKLFYWEYIFMKIQGPNLFIGLAYLCSATVD